MSSGLVKCLTKPSRRARSMSDTRPKPVNASAGTFAIFGILTQVLQELVTIHFRHRYVRDHQVETTICSPASALPAAACSLNFRSVHFQQLAEHVGRLARIVYDEYRCSFECSRCDFEIVLEIVCFSLTQRKPHTELRSAADSRLIRRARTPPCNSANCFTRARPIPMPPCRRLLLASPCRKISNTCGRNSGAIPWPVSSIVN